MQAWRAPEGEVWEKVHVFKYLGDMVAYDGTLDVTLAFRMTRALAGYHMNRDILTDK